MVRLPVSLITAVAGTLLAAGTLGAAMPARAEASLYAHTEEDIAVVYIFGTRETYRERESRSATRTPTPLEELPQSLVVITRDVIDDQAMSGLAELVRYVPGVTMGQGEGHRDAPVFRGNLTTADFFVDGMRDDLQYLRDLYNVERVDVLQGPSALVFGRGTGGGALNRVAKKADGERIRALDAGLAMFGSSRVAVDWGDKVSMRSAARVNFVLEDGRGFRDHSDVARVGVAPTWGIDLGDRTRFEAFAEYFSDQRTVDRGVPSQGGRPWRGPIDTFFGNPDLSRSDIKVRTGRGVLTHDFRDDLSLHAVLSHGDYAKSYGNVFAGGPVDPLTDTARMDSYVAATDRTNTLAQADLVWQGRIAGFAHTLLVGVEAGQQESLNRRVNASSGVFSLRDRGRRFTPDFATTPSIDNRNVLDLAALVVQEQLTLTPSLKALAGLRWDRFALGFHDRRPNTRDFLRVDNFVSPRVGLVWEPASGLALFGGWSRASLPQSGEQFNLLNATRSMLQPERFDNRELGLRWQPSRDLLLSAAAYRLDRTNSTAPGTTPGLTVLTGAQRSEGVELAVQGALRNDWQIIGAMAFQNARITATTDAAPAGRRVPLVPHFSASLWNRVRLTDRLDVGVGVIHQGEQFASISNAVVLPRHTRLDAAVFYALRERLDLQLNVENLTDETYWFTAHNDNNLSPGAPVLARLTVSARF